MAAPEESRPAGFGFLMNNTRIVIPEDSKGSVTTSDFLSNLPGADPPACRLQKDVLCSLGPLGLLEDSKRLTAKRLSSSVSACGELETASKFRKLSGGKRVGRRIKISVIAIGAVV